MYRIEFVESAKYDLRALRKSDRVKVLDKVETHLTYKPALQSRSRIKMLRLGTFPPFRLRVDEFRIYYDVIESEQLVVILGVVPKADSAEWLRRSTEAHRKGEEI
jgi:mRNA-degrading endonuclease RelE of RelBE toxin-antitoxin system